mmetsp:Transcript_74936/g.217518  ORF Transcript_74936/g.217518 Transcript_74936/m.217518 type:complete len:98 (+) Transcript_74936:167-460(+)
MDPKAYAGLCPATTLGRRHGIKKEVLENMAAPPVTGSDGHDAADGPATGAAAAAGRWRGAEKARTRAGHGENDRRLGKAMGAAAGSMMGSGFRVGMT